MRKLNFLKAIVDYVYIMSVIASPLAVIFSVLSLFNLTSGKILEYVGIWEKIAPLFVLAGIGLFVYALYYFKKLLANFKGKLIFETENCQLFHKIGKAILYFSLFLCDRIKNFLYLFFMIVFMCSHKKGRCYAG